MTTTHFIPSMHSRRLERVLNTILLSALAASPLAACASSDDNTTTGEHGVGAGGASGSAGAGGSAGEAGTGGTTGTGSSSGSAGDGGSTGNGGPPFGGSAGVAGSAGEAGTAGDAGNGGSSGSAGVAGSAGEAGEAGSPYPDLPPLDDTGFQDVSCTVSTWTQLAADLGVDSVTLYRASGVPHWEQVWNLGTDCTEAPTPDVCQDALTQALESSLFSTLHSQFDYSQRKDLLVLRIGDEIEAVRSHAELQARLVPLDTIQKIQLHFYFKGGSWEGCAHKFKQTEEGYEVISTTNYNCPFATQNVLYSIDAESNVTLLQSGPYENIGSGCAGRRPEGLQAPRTAPVASAFGAYLARQGHLEAASITAFHRMRDELAALGAPRELLDDCIKAAGDEVRHAEAMTRLAARFDTRIPEPCIAPMRERSAEQIAIENMVEGCVRETYGALLAGVQARRAGDAQLREAMATIAHEETEHAALSWRVNEFLMSTLGEQEREAVEQAKREAIEQLERELGRAPSKALMQQAGLPESALALQLFTALREQIWA